MKVIHIPLGLRLISFYMLLCVPILALQVLMLVQASLLKMPVKTFQILCGTVAVVVFLLARGISKGKRAPYSILLSAGGLWCFTTVAIAVQTQSPSLGFFAIFLLFYWIVLWQWVRHENGSSFFDPHMEWYQGLPQSIPGLKCEAVYGDKTFSARVARLDTQGAFVFSDRDEKWPIERKKRAKLVFSYGEEKPVHCQALPIRTLNKNLGAGFLFSGMSPDESKKLGDFVEKLRGIGYVL